MASGARAYHLRMILHDWPDTQALQILSHLRKAMSATPNFQTVNNSKPKPKLLIGDTILPDRAVDTSLAQACFDFNILFLSGKERTEAMWHKLLKDAGFKVVEMVRPGVGTEEWGESLRIEGLIVAEIDNDLEESETQS